MHVQLFPLKLSSMHVQLFPLKLSRMHVQLFPHKLLSMHVQLFQHKLISVHVQLCVSGLIVLSKHYVIALHKCHVYKRDRVFVFFSLILLHTKHLKMSFSDNFEQSSWANSVCADEVSASDYKRLLSLL